METGPAHWQLDIAVRTHVGLRRTENEDRALFATFSGEAHEPPYEADALATEAGAIFAVCDGMGGAAGGEVASTEAVEVLRARLARPPGSASRVEQAAQRVVDALRITARTIHDHAVREPALSGMGTTATVATLVGSRLLVAQVGDSRAYLFRAGTLTQLTRDQTLARLLVERGQLTEDEARRFEASNVILQAVGTSLHLDVDVRDVELAAGDVVLLCSDGLTGPVDDAQIADALRAHAAPRAACDALVAAALAQGGPDNVTCIVARVRGAARADLGPPRPERTTFEPFEPFEDDEATLPGVSPTAPLGADATTGMNADKTTKREHPWPGVSLLRRWLRSDG